VPAGQIDQHRAVLRRYLRAGSVEAVQERETAYRYTDLSGLARSLLGVADVGGPVLAAGIGRAGLFPNGAAFKSYTGLAPRASETGETDRKGQPMSRAGSSLLRTP
jgi:transposase